MVLLGTFFSFEFFRLERQSRRGRCRVSRARYLTLGIDTVQVSQETSRLPSFSTSSSSCSPASFSILKWNRLLISWNVVKFQHVHRRRPVWSWHGVTAHSTRPEYFDHNSLMSVGRSGTSTKFSKTYKFLHWSKTKKKKIVVLCWVRLNCSFPHEFHNLNCTHKFAI